MLRLVLVPSVVAVVLWLVASGYLVFQGFYNRQVANGVRQVSIPAVSALASIQQERRLSVAFLAQPSKDLQQLLDQRRQTDQRVAALRTAADSALALAPQRIVTRWNALTERLDQLPDMRSMIDAKSAGEQRTYAFYNDLLDAATSLFDTQARVVPDVTAAQGGIAATDVWRVSDQMSRAGSLIDRAFGSNSFSQSDYLEFVRLVNAYHAGLDNVGPNLQPAIRVRHETLAASQPWKDLIAAENALVIAGEWRSGVPRGLPLDRARWETLTQQVSTGLIDMTVAQADDVSAEALRTGNTQLLIASIGSLVALSIAIAAILWAVRQSQILVDRALSVRLAQLGEDAAAVVDERLPVMMERLRRREPVDLSVELPTRDYGDDEIGQVAGVINRSLQVAAGAAVDEAKTRAAGIAMLMGVARRPQRPLQRGLKVIESLQDHVDDEKLLAQLFDINHQLTQTRRFLENLVIVSGGQIGRRFKNPVALRRVLLAAFAEAEQYQRITLRTAPDVAVTGPAVAGTVHLLAELLDNALTFSPPETTVWVTCTEVRHGVVVEIEDAGVGMHADALHRANELLTSAPATDVTDLKDGAQVGLHVVAELAKRDGIQVSLRKSAYGGLLAIVLLPGRVIAAADPGDRAETTGALRRSTAAPAEAVSRHASLAVPAAAVALANGAAPLTHGAASAWAPETYAPAPEIFAATGGPGTYAIAGEPPEAAYSGVNGPTREIHAAATGPTPGAYTATNGASHAAPPSYGEGVPPLIMTAGSADQAGPPDRPVDGRPRLPHRQPQRHIVPELNVRDAAAQDAEPEPTVPARPPEQVRARFARYQQGRAEGLAANSEEAVTRADQGRNA